MRCQRRDPHGAFPLPKNPGLEALLSAELTLIAEPTCTTNRGVVCFMTPHGLHECKPPMTGLGMFVVKSIFPSSLMRTEQKEASQHLLPQRSSFQLPLK